MAAALETIAQAWFADGRQTFDPVAAVTELAMPVQLIWGRDDQIIPGDAGGGASVSAAGSYPAGSGASAAYGEVRVGERLISRFTEGFSAGRFRWAEATRSRTP